MNSTAYSPAHISGFFKPMYNNDFAKAGSCGAGVSVNLGAISEVSIKESRRQIIEISINNKKYDFPVIRLALKYLLSNNPLHVKVKTKIALPLGQGFGMSGACALSTSLAVSKITNVSKSDALKAAHFAEVKLKTGLGDVMGSYFGGFEIRKTPGIPPWGIIEHIPGGNEVVLCTVGKKIDTNKILSNTNKTKKITEYGNRCTQKILEKPSIENFFQLSYFFTKKTGLAGKKMNDAIETANKYGMASMCMLGNSIFAVGKTQKIIQALANFGKIYVCRVDETGASLINL